MADKKITALTSASTPLGGTEVLPIVQGNTTVKVTVNNLTAGKPVSAGQLTVENNTANNAVRITQTGSGNALVVEDEANPDTSAFVVTNNGSVGVGTLSPVARINIQSSDSTLALFDGTTTTSGPGVAVRATGVSGTAVPSFALRQWRTSFAGNQNAGEIRFDGLTTNGSYAEFASIYAVSGSNTTTGAPTALVFRTRNSSAVIDDRMFIASAGNVGVGTITPNAAAQLEVASTTTGFLPPRMTEAQRDAISTPPNGLILYNTTTDKLQVRAAGSWVNLH